MDSDVVAINVVRRMLFGRGIKSEPDAILKLAQKTLRSPSVTKEKELQTRTLAMLAQNFRVAE